MDSDRTPCTGRSDCKEKSVELKNEEILELYSICYCGDVCCDDASFCDSGN